MVLTLVLMATFGVVDEAGAQTSAIQARVGDAQRGPVPARPIDAPDTKAARGEASLQVESLPITVTLPSGQPHPAYLITAHDPGTGLFWWTFQNAGPYDASDRIANLPYDLRFFVSEREIVGVEMGKAPPSLWIVRSATRVESIADGRRSALERIAASAPKIEEGTTRWMRSVSLARALPRDFFYDPAHPMPPFDARVVAWERDGAGWVATLEGRGDRTAEVRLDRLFVLVDARVLDSPGTAAE